MLPGTQREVDLLRKLMPGAAVYTGAEAQETVVKKTAGQYRYVHLASHAFFNDASPLLSSIVLAQPPPGSQEDGFLTARELFDMNLQADMVVLSACNTARGDKRSGEGIIGLTLGAFCGRGTDAGAQPVVRRRRVHGNADGHILLQSGTRQSGCTPHRGASAAAGWATRASLLLGAVHTHWRLALASFPKHYGNPRLIYSVMYMPRQRIPCEVEVFYTRVLLPFFGRPIRRI